MSSVTKTRGLTLGKFAPLHKGHQLVIETALSEMDEVVVIIYDCLETALHKKSSYITAAASPPDVTQG